MSKKRFKPKKVKAQQVRKSRQDWDRAKFLADNALEGLQAMGERIEPSLQALADQFKENKEDE